ncbi:MAG: GatB/YqeY domain-containing protein [Deltaproteobacteria bacterium]|jgi:uncharacterized protein|nr:GatB/YqeY domain-containing protein [Deltaproteobacteria bacterium]
MTIQEKIKQDLTAAIKARDEEKKNALRVAMGEFGRSDKKSLSDDDVINILKKLIKSEREMLQQTGESEDSPFIDVIAAYLPPMAAESEITAWIKGNIDFSQFNSKMQAMGPIMKHFGAQADGNMVKEILKNL